MYDTGAAAMLLWCRDSRAHVWQRLDSRSLERYRTLVLVRNPMHQDAGVRQSPVWPRVPCWRVSAVRVRHLTRHHVSVWACDARVARRRAYLVSRCDSDVRTNVLEAARVWAACLPRTMPRWAMSAVQR